MKILFYISLVQMILSVIAIVTVWVEGIYKTDKYSVIHYFVYFICSIIQLLTWNKNLWIYVPVVVLVCVTSFINTNRLKAKKADKLN